MRYKMTKKYQICHHQIRFFKLKMHRNPFSAGAPPAPLWGAYNAPPDHLVGWGGGYPSPPYFPPRSIPSASRTRRLRRLGSQAPSTQNPGYASAVPVILSS